MPNTVVGLYQDENQVRTVMDELVEHDFPRRAIDMHDSPSPRLRDRLADQGVPQGELDDYLDGIRRGGKLVVLEATDDRTRDALEIMRRHERGGVAGAGATAGAAHAGAAGDAKRGATRTNAEGEESVEVVEEELDVGTREVERGGVRVNSYVTERPVEEEVRVRDESVHVDRRPVDRPVGDAEAEDAFRERSVEMHERDEEAVVGKRARVIEEIVLSKDVDEHTETVRDTVRRTDVEVEGDDAGGTYAFDDDRDHFRGHHRDTFSGSEYGYEDYEPAYRYGTDLAAHPDYRDREWSDVSPSARERWERQNQGTWNEFEPAVRYGYDRARTRGRR